MKNYAKVILLILSFLLALQQSLSRGLSPPDRLVDSALKEVGVSKTNNPQRVLWYLSSVKINYMTSYCAAFVRKMMDIAKVNFNIRSSLARKYVTSQSIKARDVWAGKRTVPKGALVIWFRTLSSWQGHIGINCEFWAGKKGKTVEGNTSRNNTREGGNVELKIRVIEPYNYFRIEYFTPIS